MKSQNSPFMAIKAYEGVGVETLPILVSAGFTSRLPYSHCVHKKGRDAPQGGHAVCLPFRDLCDRDYWFYI
jgi:hypothetical protein